MEPKFITLAKSQSVCDIINSISIENRRGDLPNLTKSETATLLLQYADRALGLADDEHLVVELPDGRLLIYYHHVFPASSRVPELREWKIDVYTLKQKTARSLRKWHYRKAWLYIAPYTEEKGYKTDPTGKWSYRVWW